MLVSHRSALQRRPCSRGPQARPHARLLAAARAASPHQSSSSPSNAAAAALLDSEHDGPQQCAQRILQCWQDRRLEGLLPFMSELAVVKAVVRQHHAKLEQQKQLDKLHEQQAQQQAQQQQRTQYGAAAGVAQPASSSYTPDPSSYDNSSMRRYSSSSGSGLATFDETPQPQQQQHWGTPPARRTNNYTPPPAASPPPARPHCPVPGVDSSSSPSPSSTPDYADQYASFNYAQRYNSNNSNANSPYETPFPGSDDQEAAYASDDSADDAGSSAAFGLPPKQRAAAAAARAPDFLSVLDCLQAGEESHHLLDSYAMRHLVLSRPALLEPLSGMRLGPDAFVLRVRSSSLWGERCVLTFTLKRRSEQELKSVYSKQPRKEAWVLSKVVGEPLNWDPLEAISPEHPPEVIVAAQVAALKECDFDVAYALTSPVGRAVAGTRDRFRAALQGDYRYQPVLMHESATSIHRTHSNANTYLEVFDVRAHAGAPSSLFIWVATRQLEGLYKNCWMVEYVTGPIRDKSVIKALQIGL